MARYIDADKFIDFLKKEKETAISIGDGIRAYETQHRIDLVNSQPSADVVPKSEVEKIFEEIEKLMLDGTIGGKYPVKVINPDKYAELKKKYTEDKNV